MKKPMNIATTTPTTIPRTIVRGLNVTVKVTGNLASRFLSKMTISASYVPRRSTPAALSPLKV